MTSFLARARSAAHGLPGRANAVLQFWFGNEEHWPASETTTEEDAKTAYLDSLPSQMGLWFGGGKEVDEKIKSEYEEDLTALDADPKAHQSWTASDNPRASLAFIILTDQFPRNIFRGTTKSFAYDNIALQTTLSLLDDGRFSQLRPVERMFCLMPLEHSEDIQHHDRMATALQETREEVKQLGDEATTNGCLKLLDTAESYLHSHTKVLRQFGRYPHRNKVLGRETTPEEEEYLRTAETWGQ